MDATIEAKIQAALEGLFTAVSQLQAAHPGKPFTLDGRLVGDIGEVASLAYKLTLNEGLTNHHDAVCDEGRNVQIKTTFGTSLTFPVHHVPDYYLGIRMNRDGTFEEVYNGPGFLIQQQLASRKPTRTGLHGGLMAMLRRINATVAEEDCIPRR
ncbi:hypothetical protein CHR29_23990 [Pseudomonas monteilii]|uniref:DUF6998 domain-containing protein n=1 Tax=Pseudomonas monteilii TaxID=76759 RepID=A0AAP7FMU2_9PSED|nr:MULTISPECIES: hypothetical protein [Pseudomonas]AYN18046.1 hypothetical protein CHR29_23990 [Pseudomonas monteilii]AYN98242.1 hypothetical protein D8767_04335 [Pseudomonas sp. LTGT-11-2Z]MBA6104526.1 hypothetical protein [Pseudomonas monteilii]MCE0876588.1 hypothetical protein [Pseudomonas monteilii]MCE0924567.1 hypothetical protein [Pseudomonas monteilii]